MQKLINLSNYPIDQPSDKLNIVIDQVRNDLEKDGCAIIRGFLSNCLLYTSPSPRDKRQSRMPSSA